VTSSIPTAALFRLDNDVAIITGGLGRLGGQYARALAGAGASVALFDVAERSNPVVATLAAEGAPISIHVVDATRRDAVDREVARVAARFGTPTVLVNNAGLGSSPADGALETGRFEQYPESAWDAMMESHLKSAFIASQSFVAAFRGGTRRSGSIVNISSTYGVVTPDQSVYEYRRRGGAEYFKPVGYSVAKAGMLNFTRTMALELDEQKIRVNAIAPDYTVTPGVRGNITGPVDPASWKQPTAEQESATARRIPLGRAGIDTECGNVAVFLASSMSEYVTGTVVPVDGGAWASSGWLRNRAGKWTLTGDV